MHYIYNALYNAKLADFGHCVIYNALYNANGINPVILPDMAIFG